MSKKNIVKLKKCWLITWKFYNNKEDEKLKEAGIKNKIIDIVSDYKDFDYISEYTKSIYKLLVANYQDKISLAHRGRYKMKNEDFFENHHIFTSRDTILYKKINTLTEKQNSRYKKNLELWKNHSIYINIGHNPSIYARKVFNLFYEEGVFEWEEVNTEGIKKTINYKPKF